MRKLIIILLGLMTQALQIYAGEVPHMSEMFNIPNLHF